MKYKVKYGTSDIEFTLHRKDRKTLAIHVYPDKKVEVIAPINSSIESIYAKVLKRGSWINKQKFFFSKIQPHQDKPSFVSGESFRYLGKQVRLKVIHSKKEEVKLKEGRLILSISKEKDSELFRNQLIQNWYKEKAQHLFAERFEHCIQKVEKIGIKTIPDWKVKSMKNRWGSCSKKKVLYLNPELIAAPKPCIDYVLIHELCHLLEFNHSTKFYALLSKVYPTWKKWKEFLDQNIEVRLV